MKSWLRASAFGCLIHLVGYPLLLIFAFGSAMSAFSPNYKPKKRVYWKQDEEVLSFVWNSGYKISSTLVDYLIFGSPLPPPAINPDFGDPKVYEKIKALNDAHYPEFERRKLVYRACWAFNTLFFGMMFGGIYCFIKLIFSSRRLVN